MHDTKNGKTAYRNEASGAMLHFDSDQKRWLLVCNAKKGRKEKYSSLENAERDVPWSESGEISGASWQLDRGCGTASKEGGFKFKFKGMTCLRCLGRCTQNLYWHVSWTASDLCV